MAEELNLSTGTFRNTENIKVFTIRYYVLNDEGTQFNKHFRCFDSLLDALIFFYGLELNNVTFPHDNYTIYNKETKKKIISGTINEIYLSYLETYKEKIDVEKITNIPSISHLDDCRDHPSIKRLIEINSL